MEFSEHMFTNAEETRTNIHIPTYPSLSYLNIFAIWASNDFFKEISHYKYSYIFFFPIQR